MLTGFPPTSAVAVPVCGTCFALLGATSLFNKTLGKLLGLNIPSPCDALLGEAIDLLAGLLPGGDKPTPPGPAPATINSGKASARLSAQFQFTPDNKLLFFGAPPVSTSNGTGAELVVPVAFSRDSTGNGGLVTLAPMLHSSISKQQGNGETVSEVNNFQKSFEVEITTPPPPPPEKVNSFKTVGPFRIASDKLLDENDEPERLFQFIKGQKPNVRKSLEDGTLPIRVTGRTSTSGSKAFNLQLSERRTKRVRQFLLDFAGSNSQIVTFSSGEFETPTPDNKEDANQRVVEVVIQGEVPGEASPTASSASGAGAAALDEGAAPASAGLDSNLFGGEALELQNADPSTSQPASPLALLETQDAEGTAAFADLSEFNTASQPQDSEEALV